MEINKVLKEAVDFLLAEDLKFKRDLLFSRWVSRWDIEEMRFDAAEKMMVIPKEVHGIEITLVADDSKIDGSFCMDIGEYVTLQGFPPQDFMRLIDIYKVFKCKFVNINDKDFRELKRYCDKMDNNILAASFGCAKLKISNIFEKMWIEMGGENIDIEDRLGRRICYLKRVVERYKENNDVTILKRLGYVK